MADREYLVLSAIEVDRPGLVADLTGFIDERGCNIEDSRLVVIAGYAGLLFLVSGEPAAIQSVIDGLEAFRERSRVRAIPRRVPSLAATAESAAPRHVVEASAIDHRGIVHGLTDLVRQHGGNILELETTTESAPMSGEPLFALRMEITLPPGEEPARRLGADLAETARAEAMDVRFYPADIERPVG